MVPGHGLLWAGDPENLMNLILFLLDSYTDLEVPFSDPVEMPPYGLYLPFRGFYRDLESYRRASNFDPELPTVGMLFYSGMHFDDTRPLVEELYSRSMEGLTVPWSSQTLKTT